MNMNMIKSKQALRVEHKLEALCRELDALGIEYSYDQFVDIYSGEVLPGSHSFRITCASRYEPEFLYPSAIQFTIYLHTELTKLFSCFHDFRYSVPNKLKTIENKPHASIDRLRQIVSSCEPLVA